MRKFVLNIINQLKKLHTSLPGGKNSHFFFPQTLADQLKERNTSAWNGVLVKT